MKQAIRSKYREIAFRQVQGSSSCCGSHGKDPVCSDLYDVPQTASVPEHALKVSLGCGNPTALAELKPGEVVLDLGCGGGIDVLLAAQQVGPHGKVYGLDMTTAMLDLARENQRKAGLQNIEFLEGEMENIPLPDGSVDVIISNCVVNLSPDKDRVFREAFRVLRPGGRLAISDIVVRGEPPAGIRRSIGLWIGCLAGALEESDYRRRLEAVGFCEIRIQPTRSYRAEDAREFLSEAGVDVDALRTQWSGCFLSAFVGARKPCGRDGVVPRRQAVVSSLRSLTGEEPFR